MADYTILVPPSRRYRRKLIVVGLAIIVVAVAVGAFVVGRHTDASGPAAKKAGAAATPTTAVAPLTVASTTPAPGATDVPSNQVVTVNLSAPVTIGTGTPTFSPPVPGTWERSGRASLVFEATAPFIPTSTETLTIPDGAAGPTSTHGAVLAAPVTVIFTVAQASTERLQQLLAEAGYLPLTFTATGSLPPNGAATAQPGTFAHPLGCEKWFKQSGLDVERNACAIVDDLHERLFALPGSMHADVATDRGRVNGIVEEIGPGDVQLAAKSGNRRQIAKCPLDLKVFLLGLVVQHCQRDVDSLVHVNRRFDRGLIHVRVGLHRSDRLGDSRRRTLQVLACLADFDVLREPGQDFRGQRCRGGPPARWRR